MSNNTLLAVGVIFAIIIHASLKNISNRNMIARALYDMFGTAAHEASHFLTAWVFNGKPTSFSIFPKNNGNGKWTFGYVDCMNITWYNAIPIGLSPLLLFPVAFYIYTSEFLILDSIFLSMMLKTVLGLMLVGSALPSLPDLRVATKSIFGVFFYFTLLLALYVHHKGYYNAHVLEEKVKRGERVIVHEIKPLSRSLSAEINKL